MKKLYTQNSNLVSETDPLNKIGERQNSLFISESMTR